MDMRCILNHPSQSSKCGDSQLWVLGALPLLSVLDPPQWIDGDQGFRLVAVRFK